MVSTPSSTLALQQEGDGSLPYIRLLPSIMKLAGWRFRRMWRFLFVTWLGLLAMVVLICALPLFSRVAISADLRNIAANSPDGQNIFVQVTSTSPTEQQIQQISQQIDLLLQQSGFETRPQGQSPFVVQTPPLSIVSDARTTSADNTRLHGVILDGYDPTFAAPYVTLVQGHLPQVTSDDPVEIALTQDVATLLNVHVGSYLQGSYPATLDSQPHLWTLHVVGIITRQPTRDGFAAKISPFGTRYTQENGATAFSVLAAAQTVSAKSADLQVASEQGATHLIWRYPLNITQLDANDIPQLSQQASNLQQSLAKTLTRINGVTFANPFGTLFNTLSTYNQHIVVLNIVLTFLLLIILAIVLFLVSMMSDVLVEQQSAVIAMLRSRGATRRHIFGTFVTQGIVLGLAALLMGPLLSLLLVRLIAQVLLSPIDQPVISVITAHPLQAILDVKWYALVAVVVGLFVMIVAIRQAAKLDIVTLRRESSRTKRVSLWRRLYLDYLLVLLIVTGYGAYIYFWQEISTQSGDPVLYNILQAVSFIAPALIIAALLMLFLRLFPHILRLTTNLAVKRRGAPAVLAFAHMERAPRSAMRIAILLALAMATSCFLLTLIATKNARTSEAANFAVGADFHGSIPVADSAKTFATLKTQYSHVLGVQSATLGYYTSIDTVSGVTRIEAVDADTYADTALWTQQNPSESLPSLTAQLVSHRADASAQNVVYALVDSAMWRAYHLSPGEGFSILVDDTKSIRISFIALAEVPTIPGIYDTPINPSNGVGLLVDYQSYNTVYAKESGTPLGPNTMWLRTRADTASLASVRYTFPDLADRRRLTADNEENNVHLDIIGVLMIGIGAVLVLALVGTLVSSWLNAASRRANFAVMRALGMTSRQIAAVLLWEQGFVYIVAFVLGIGLGAMLIIFVAPTVSLLDLAGPSGSNNPYDMPSVLTTVPYTQLFTILFVMSLICLGALLLMSRIVSRPLLSMMLRLNED